MKSLSGSIPSRRARGASTDAGHESTRRTTIGSRSNLTRSRAALPPTASSASSISFTLTLSAGRLIAVRPPNASREASATLISAAIVPAVDPSATRVSGATGHTAGSPLSGSRMMEDKNPDAAPLGLPGRTTTVFGRTLRPSMKPFARVIGNELLANEFLNAIRRLRSRQSIVADR